MTALTITYEKDYAIVKLDHGKVNAIDRQLSKDLRDAFLDLEQNKEVRGVLLTGRPHCFSAGLNIGDLAQGGLEAAKEFWVNYIGALQAMVRFSKPLVCAITGYAVAGATIFAICADYRVMGKGEKHRIGMNEFNASMLIPEMMGDLYAYQLGESLAWKMIQKAKLFTSDEAVAVGLVDESVEVDEVEARATKHLQRLLKVYTPIYQQSKTFQRKALRALVDKDIPTCVEKIAENWNDPFVQKSMEFFVASLKK